MSRLAVLLAVLGVSLTSVAADEKYLAAKKNDPGKLCAQAQKRFPGSLADIRGLDKVVSEKVRPDTDYCHEDLLQCEVRDIALPGLEVSLLVKKATSTAGIMTLTVSDPKWKTLQPLFVGGKLTQVEHYFGVKAKNDSAVLKVIGECMAIDVHHTNGRVTKMQLDCQSC